MEKLKIYNYSGSKIKFVDTINTYINKSNATTYVEPFLGSGAVFLNLEKEFDRYILNDLDSNVVKIFNAFKNSYYSDIEYIKDLTTNKYDIRNNKDDYYEFRDLVNKNKDRDDDMYGLSLYFLFNACINSMARFGPNGFNQSWGKRYKCLTKEEFNLIKNRISRAEIHNDDFFNLDIPDNSLLFLDPPYIERPAAYKTISNDFFNKLMTYINETNNDILYTDIDHNFLDLEKIVLRENMKNTAPSSKKENTKTEVMFYKIK